MSSSRSRNPPLLQGNLTAPVTLRMLALVGAGPPPRMLTRSRTVMILTRSARSYRPVFNALLVLPPRHALAVGAHDVAGLRSGRTRSHVRLVHDHHRLGHAVRRRGVGGMGFRVGGRIAGPRGVCLGVEDATPDGALRVRNPGAAGARL